MVINDILINPKFMANYYFQNAGPSSFWICYTDLFVASTKLFDGLSESAKFVQQFP